MRSPICNIAIRNLKALTAPQALFGDSEAEDESAVSDVEAAAAVGDEVTHFPMTGVQFEADPPVEGAPREEAEEKSEVEMIKQFCVNIDSRQTFASVKEGIYVHCKLNMNFSLSHGTKPLARIEVGQNLK